MSNPSAQPFLDAIRAAPEDDAPRLIYADWLDEQGDESSRDRAAFIRAQCAAGSLWQTSPAPASEVADRDAISR
ncbi:MAG TPA: TIGR02996 domain-containing protein, partial [Pirellulales bacterium]